MTRITKLTIENYRGFYGGPYTVDLPQGQNLLLYGENGSGKSSLLMALRELLASSDGNWPQDNFVSQANKFHSGAPNPKVSIELSSISQNQQPTIIGTYTCEANPNRNSNHTNVKNLNSITAHLNYRSLLKLQTSPNNIFDLAINDLLSDIILQDSSLTIKERWISISTRMARPGSSGRRLVVQHVGQFTNSLRTLIQDYLQPLVNAILKEYFPHLSLTIIIGTPTLGINSYGRITGNTMQFRVNLSELDLADYSTHLNEARINAVAIALFLAGRILVNKFRNSTTGILILDDIFIGLDSANRIPLLEILDAEAISLTMPDGREETFSLFKNFQIFLATYDRQWFEKARYWFQSNTSTWSFQELYVNRNAHILNQEPFDKPLGPFTPKTYLGQGILHLSNVSGPDVASAANCFRKQYEKLINQFLPKWETQTASKTAIEDHKLGLLSKKLLSFLHRIGSSQNSALIIDRSLYSLLHPFSHGVNQAPAYRTELNRVANALIDLENQLVQLDIQNQYKLGLESGKKLELKIELEPNHFSIYVIQLIDPLVINKSLSPKSFMKSKCKYISCYGKKDDDIIKQHTFSKNKQKIFECLDDCYNSTLSFVQTEFSGLHSKGSIIKTSYVDAISYSGGIDSNGNPILIPLSNLLTR